MASTVDAGRPRRGWYYGWNIVAVTVLAQAVANGLPINGFSLLLRPWAHDLHASISQLQLGLAGCGLVASLLSPFVGYLADKIPARLMFGAGLAGMAVFFFAMSGVSSSDQMAVLYALLFPLALVCCTTIPANAVVSRWFVRRLGLALGVTGFGLAVSGVVIPPLVAWAEPQIGWRAIWRIAAALTAFIILPVVVLVLRPRPTEREGLHYVTGHDAEAAHGHGHGHDMAGAPGGLTYGRIVSRPNFWLLVAVYVPILAVYGACGQNLGPIAASRGLGPQSAALLISAYCLAQTITNLVVGLLSDRFGNRLPLAGLAAVTALGGVAIAFSGSLPGLLLGAALSGCGGGFWPLLAAAFTVEFGRAGFGRAFGMAAFFIPVGGFSPVIVSKLQEGGGSYVPGLLTFAAICALGGALCLLLREKRRPRAPDADAPLQDSPLTA